MWQRLSYLGNVVLLFACIALLVLRYLGASDRPQEGTHAAEEFLRRNAERKVEMAAQDEEFQRQQAALQAKIDELEAQVRELERRGDTKAQ